MHAPSSSKILYLLLGVGAIAAPLLLAFAGWDEFRWAFLLTANFFIVLWLWLGDSGRSLSIPCNGRRSRPSCS